MNAATVLKMDPDKKTDDRKVNRLTEELVRLQGDEICKLKAENQKLRILLEMISDKSRFNN